MAAKALLAAPVKLWLARAHAIWQEAGRGTVVGLVLLAGLLAVMLGTDNRAQRAVRLGLFDLYQQYFVRERVNDNVVVVAIDDASVAELGQWPWPRQQVAQLIARIAAQKPAVMGLDIVFSEPDRRSPIALVQQLVGDGLLPTNTPMQNLPDSDQLLAAAIAKAPVVLGVGGLPDDAGLLPGNDYRPRIRQFGGDASRFAPGFPASLRSIIQIDAAAAGHGVFNTTASDGVVREVPTVLRLGQSLQPGFAVEILRIAFGVEQLNVRLDALGISTVAIADQQIATNARGEWFLHFSNWLDRPHFSAVNVLRGKLPEGLLTGRVVLLGYTALGLQDNIKTPLGLMPGVEAHAEAIDNLLDHRLLNRPRWAPLLEAALLTALTLMVIVLVPLLPPLATAAITTLLVALALAAGTWAFVARGLLLDTANPVLQTVVVYAVVLAFSLSAAQKQRRRLRLDLAASREQQARLEGELDAARRIQMGMLPNAAEVLGDEQRLEIAARMQSARTVGGDLYDFFRLDERRLFFLVGDVSGKGLPASLFMALAKALTRAAAQQVDGDPARALVEAAAAIGRENPEYLFVTMLAGVIDLGNGRVSWCNAGHEAPIRLASSASLPEQLKGESGPPLCVVDDYLYVNVELQLEAGDALCILTDGITEAHDAADKLYGHERLNQCLTLAMHASPKGLIDAVEQDVSRFAAGVEQSDDLTILVLRWAGPGLSGR